MTVSILIPTYNRAYIVGAALKSALDQTYSNFEIVVVDDGSTDNTREVVQSFANEKIRYIKHELNRGYSAACNTAISEATGEILGFLDSDDRWKPNYLEKLIGFIDRHPEVDAVFSDLEIQGAARPIPSLTRLMQSFPNLLLEEREDAEYVFSCREMYLCLLEEVPIKPSALLTRKQVYARAGTFNESWPSGTDWDLFLRFAEFAKFGYIDEPLVIQKWSSDATHRKFWEKDKMFLLDIFLREKKELRRNDDKEALRAINRGLASHYSNLAYVYLNSRRRRKSFITYLQGFKECHDMGFLLRAATALLPVSLRKSLKRALKPSLTST